jgi:hypothetical protein
MSAKSGLTNASKSLAQLEADVDNNGLENETTNTKYLLNDDDEDDQDYYSTIKHKDTNLRKYFDFKSEEIDIHKSITAKSIKYKIDPKKTRILLTTRIHQGKSQQPQQPQQQQQVQQQLLQPINQGLVNQPMGKRSKDDFSSSTRKRVQSGSMHKSINQLDFINFKTNLLSIQHQEEIYSLIGGGNVNAKKKSKDISCLNIDFFRQNGMFTIKSSLLNSTANNANSANNSNDANLNSGLTNRASNAKLVNDTCNSNINNNGNIANSNANSNSNPKVGTLNEKSTLNKSQLLFTKNTKRPKTSKT